VTRPGNLTAIFIHGVAQCPQVAVLMFDRPDILCEHSHLAASGSLAEIEFIYLLTYKDENRG